jgi:hemoglobin
MVMPTRNAIATLVLVVVATTGVTGQKEASAKSLYHRLGGYDAIATIVNDLERRFGEDPELRLFTVGVSADTGKRQTQMLVEFLCERTGGPCAYLGRDMKTTHAGLTITEAHWKATMGHLGAALDAANVPEQERSELMEIFEKLKSDIDVK